jgi:RNA polymerase sigma-70 factor, ECF subfamily
LEAIIDEGCGDPSRAADLDQLRNRMDAALQTLPELVRTVFILYEINGLRYRQIAEQLEIPLNSVKVHLLRARRKLQELLRKERAWTNS